MYDEVSLILAFERAGFVDVERRGLHQSRIEGIEKVETRDDLIVEGIKPEVHVVTSTSDAGSSEAA
jgi:hypothetical protein